MKYLVELALQLNCRYNGKTMVKIIVAYDKNRLIGANNTLPWKIKEEMAHFKRTTLNQVVVMGNTTYESIGMPVLPKRENVVITRNPDARYHHYAIKYQVTDKSPVFLESFDEALRFAAFVHPSKDVFVIGGTSIYKLALESGLVDEIIVSLIKGDYVGDTYFPEIPSNYIAYPAEGPLLTPKSPDFDILLYRKSPKVDTIM